MRSADRLALLALSALWGGGFLFVRIAVPEFGPFALVATRVLLAGLLMLAWAGARGGVPPFWRRGRDYLVLGALNVAFPFTLSSWALLTVPASLAAIIMATVPLFTAPLAAVNLRVVPSPRQILGLAVGFVGVAILVGFGSVAMNGDNLAAVGALMGTAFFYAVGGIYTAHKFTGVSPIESTIGQQFAAFALLLPFALVFPPPGVPSSTGIAALVLLTLFPTVVAYLLYFRLISAVGPTQTAMTAYLIPLFGVVWGVVLLGEQITGFTVVGMAIILLGVVLVTGARQPVPRDRLIAEARTAD
ncbi:MAG: EamA family transporter [Thermomicrobiales bacterium]|nr:EamA family transporter [Thermomicrobiales bacterium]